MKTGLVSLAAAIGFAALPAEAQGVSPGDGFMWHHGYGWENMIGGMLMMVLFWGGLIVLAVFAVRWLASSNSSIGPSGNSSRAEDILRERFARGEIDKEEFEERKRVLSDS